MQETSTHAAQLHTPGSIEGLSRRQLDVLELLARGLTNEELAGVLKISPATVRTHVTAVLARLDVSNRTEATAMYIAWSADPTPASIELRRPAIAVLPFVAVDDDARGRAIARALGHDLSALFARGCWFPVIPHAEATRLPSADLSLSERGQRLGASFLVEGTLRKESSWRLSVRIDSATSCHCMWNDHHDFPDDQLFAVQDAVCEAIVTATYPMLIAHTRAGMRRASDPDDARTWELVHEGMRLHATREAAANAAARSLFRAALEREPEFTLAHFGLGLTLYDALQNHWSPREDASDRIRICAERCLILAPHAAEGHYLLGCYFELRGERSLAARAMAAAIRQNPCFPAIRALLTAAHEPGTDARPAVASNRTPRPGAPRGLDRYL